MGITGKEVKKMWGIMGFGSVMAFIFSIIVFCIFCGMFLRLGRIEIILKKMAIHQGAIEKEDLLEEPYFTNAKDIKS
jgi:hypothetical protein